MVTDTPPRIAHLCNGSLDEFTFSFPLIDSSDLVVTILNTVTNVATILAETTDYTVTDSEGVTGVLADFSNGGTVTTLAPSPYSASYRITLERQVPYAQSADFTEGMPTLYEEFERAVDKLTMEVQQLKDKLNRSPYCPAIDPTSLNMEMPNATDRAGKYLGFDAQGEPLAVDLMANDITVTAYGETIIATNNATEARIVLDIAAGIKASLLDEDNFASDSNTAAPTQQSVKAYIAAQNLVAIQAAMPAGGYLLWPGETPPVGFLECNGASLLRATYAALYAAIGTMYGAADGTHFTLPDWRGRFPRIWTHGTPTDPDGAARTNRGDGATGDHNGTKQGEALKSHDHAATGSAAQDGDHSHSATYRSSTANGAEPMVAIGDGAIGAGVIGLANGGVHSHAITVTVSAFGGNETRPINMYAMMCVKY